MRTVAALPVFLALSLTAAAQVSPGLSCLVSAVPPVVRVEGIAERMGDIVAECTGGTPNGELSGNLTVFLTVNITNRLSQSGALDVILTSDTGAGPAIANVPATVQSPGAIAFNGLRVPLSPTGTVRLRISNLRGAAAMQMGGLAQERSIYATLAFNGGTLLNFTN